jgi:DNA-binding response OmpR family regulator
MNQPASQVLLVEDDPRMPEVLAGLLQDDNVTLSSATDAATGFKLAHEKRFDVILPNPLSRLNCGRGCERCCGPSFCRTN